MVTQDLPAFIRDMLSAPPRAGEGVHRWLFRVARQLHAHLPAGEILTLLENCVANCGRPVLREEIISAVQNSLASAWQAGGQSQPVCAAPKWPSVNEEQREAIISDGGDLADLWELSRIRIEDSRERTEEIVDGLFPGDPLLCCGKSHADFETNLREEWRGELSHLQFIVPSPMSEPLGRKKNPQPGESELSAHTLANTGPRRYLVCEFDTGDVDEHATLLIHLGGYAPLVCAVHSGGKSLHGWFYVSEQPEDRVLKFFRYAVSLGADPATWTRSQFVRMPDGLRDSGERQTVFFLNFKPLEATR